MQKKPLVTVLIPLYGAEKYVAETLESVLNQEYENFEVLIIDDCGNDNSYSIAIEYAQKDSRIKVLKNDCNRGIAYTRNRGISESKGEFIALLDDDDIIVGQRIKEQVEFLVANEDFGAVGGNAQWIDSNGNLVRDTIELVYDENEIRMWMCFRNIFNNSEMMFRKSVVINNGSF